jgi:hypothetical protein
VLEYTVGRLVCTMPPGVGVGFEVLLNNVWALLAPAAVGYSPPTITDVSPSVVLVVGGALTITGTNFGPSPCAVSAVGPAEVLLLLMPAPNDTTGLTFDPRALAWSPAAALVPVATPCPWTLWGPSTITCQVPPGADGNVTVTVARAGRTSAPANGLLHFAPPILTRVTTASELTTTGGTVLTLQGTGFLLPPWPMAVTVGAALCVVDESARSSRTLECTAPRGVGTQLVWVHTPSQSSVPDVNVTYAAPVISAVLTPAGRSIEGGFPVVVLGRVSDWCTAAATAVDRLVGCRQCSPHRGW